MVTGGPNGPWFTSLPPCEALVPCGQGQHAVRWEAGELRLPSHTDPEAELVLAALGGEKARCVEIAEAWRRHTADLTVPGIGPRSAADEVAVSWDDVDAAEQAARGGTGGPGRWGWRLASPPRAAMARAAIRHQQYQEEAGEANQRRLDMLSLVALVAERWLGIDPDQVEVSLHRHEGWGSVELTGRGEQRRLRVSLPAWWLARVWACGLALTGRHLVVAVERAGWPDAQVLALRAPGAEPVSLSAHATGSPPGTPDAPHWEI